MTTNYRIVSVLLVWAFGLPLSSASAASVATTLPILVYHEIRASGDEPADGPTAISLARFESQMRYLHDQGYTTLTMADVVRFLKGEPFPEKIVAIHLDDGWKSGLATVPVLNKYGFSASFWIIAGTGIGWPHMDWDEVESVAANPQFEVFSHTMTHPWQPNDTLIDWLAGRTPGKGLDRARWEVVESKHVLEEKLQRPVKYLAWPSGHYNETLIDLAHAAGYEALLTIDSGLNVPGGDLLRVHRTMIDGACGDDVFRQILADGKAHICDGPPPGAPSSSR